MKHSSDVIRALSCLFAECCLVLPLYCLLFALLPGLQTLLLFSAGPVCGVLAILLRRRSASMPLLFAGIFLCAAVGVCFGCLLSGIPAPFGCLFVPLYLGFLFLRGWQHCGHTWNAILFPKSAILLLFLDLAGVLTAQFFPVFTDLQPLLTISCFVSLIVFAFTMNTLHRLEIAASLRTEQDTVLIARRLAPVSRHLIVVLIMAAILFVILLGGVFLYLGVPWERWTAYLAALLKRGISVVSKSLSGPLKWLFDPYEEEIPKWKQELAPEPEPEPDLPEVPPLWSDVVDPIGQKILQGLLLLLVIAVVLYAAFRFLQWIAARYSALFRQERKRTTTVAVEYEDSYESLLRLRDLPGMTVQRLHRVLRSDRKPWPMLRSERERIRYLYHRVILNAEKRGYRKQDSDTPREAFDHISRLIPGNTEIFGELVTMYEQICYGNRELPAGSAERIHASSACRYF